MKRSGIICVSQASWSTIQARMIQLKSESINHPPELESFNGLLNVIAHPSFALPQAASKKSSFAKTLGCTGDGGLQAREFNILERRTRLPDPSSADTI